MSDENGIPSDEQAEEIRNKFLTPAQRTAKAEPACQFMKY
jgi:hypothetical protein